MSKAKGKTEVKFNKNANTAFIAMDNIENFTRGAKEYGLPETDLFQSIDLHEGAKATMLNVINSLNRLGFLVGLYITA